MIKMHIKKLNVQYQFHFKAWGVFSQLNSGKIQAWDSREKQEKTRWQKISE
jgi:hypothetical protein